MLSVESCYFFTIQPPPISTRTATRFPYSTLFRSAGATEEVAGHRLVGVDHDVVDVGAEHGVQHEALGDVAPRGGGGVRVDVEDPLRVDVPRRECQLDGAGAAAALGVGLCDVMGVVADPRTEHLGIDLGAAGTGMLLGLEIGRAQV